ncbi:MAG: serine O-acetyltransferase [Clostridiales bacterium]|jgi:serine O-acetyltransferase|nr:serine O-acetyltransferase [Clostridiales bacterium]
MPQDYNMDINEFNNITKSLLSSYKKHSGNELSTPDFFPDRTSVTEVVETLRQLVFPGYFDKHAVGLEYSEYRIGTLLFEVKQKLQKQIYRVLIHQNEETDRKIISDRAREISSAFLKKIPDIRETLLTDVSAVFEGDPAAKNKHEIIFAYPGMLAVSVYRLAHELYAMSVPLIPRIMTEYAHSFTGIDINPGAKIGRYFFMDHGTGIVIGETTEIGNYVKIYQGVTVGAVSTRGGQSLRGKKRHPTLEDYVTVYSGASILGGDTIIGRGSVIGSNTFITRSVPPNTRVSIKAPELTYKETTEELDYTQ